MTSNVKRSVEASKRTQRANDEWRDTSAPSPKLLTTADVARVMGWTTRRAWRWLLSTGAGVKRGGRVVTTKARLIAHFPEAYQEVALSRRKGDDDW